MNQMENLEKSKNVLPYQDSPKEKQEQVKEMFDSIAPRYDFLNHLLSFRIDKIWRRKALRFRQVPHKTPNVLDIATGTGDFIIEIQKQIPEVKKITGLDLSEGMLDVARKKIAKKKFADRVELRQGDSLRLPFPDNSFDLITVAFGVRNFADLQQGLHEMLRTLKPAGSLIILEFAKPQKFPVKPLFHFYFKYILPIIGKKVSKDEAAYSYLPKSVQEFPFGEKMQDILQETGFSTPSFRSLSFGIAMVYHASKK